MKLCITIKCNQGGDVRCYTYYLRLYIQNTVVILQLTVSLIVDSQVGSQTIVGLLGLRNFSFYFIIIVTYIQFLKVKSKSAIVFPNHIII